MLPVWWVLGVSGIVLSLCTLPLIAALVLRRRILVPRGFGLYLVFLLWCVFSATQLASSRQAFSSGYRGSLYVGAGLLFLYVLNASRVDLPPDRIVGIMAGFFVLTVVGGVIGMIVPNISFTTVARGLVPPSLLADQFVSDLVSASTSSGRAFAAYPIYRPKAPFIYANEWGAAYAMSLPFALCAVAKARTKARRDMLLIVVWSRSSRSCSPSTGARGCRPSPACCMPRSVSLGAATGNCCGSWPSPRWSWCPLLRDTAGRDRDDPLAERLWRRPPR